MKLTVEATSAELDELVAHFRHRAGLDTLIHVTEGIANRLHAMETKMAEIDDKLAANAAALADLTSAVDSVVADLSTEHQQLLDAMAALAAAVAAGQAPTAEQLAAVQASTDNIGALAGRLRQVVADTPDPNAPTP